MIQALVIGLVQGGIYGLIALGLVLCYRGSRVLNFAQAEIGAASLFVAWIVVGAWHRPYWMGALAAILAALVIGLLFERFIVRPMAAAARLVGIPQAAVSMFTWGAASVLSALAALLIEPTITLIAPNTIGPQLFIGGLASALLGGLTSLSGALVGGLLVGVLTSEATQLAPSGVSGAYTVVLFVIVIGVLLLRPQGLLGRAPARAETA